MSVQKGLILLLLVALTLPLAGCWDNREPQLRAYVLGMAIDPDPEEQEGIIVSLQLPVPKAAGRGKEGGGGGGGEGEQYFLVEGRGESVITAVQRAQDRVSRELFFGQMRAIVLSSQLTGQQLEHIMIGLRNNPDIEDTVYLAVTAESAADALRLETRLERLPALFFNSVFEAVRRTTVSEPVQLWQFWRAQETSGWEPVIPRVEQVEKNEMKVSGLAAYQGYQFVGFLSEEESQGYLWLQGRTRSRSLEVVTPEGVSTVRSLWVSSRVDLRFEGNRPVFRVGVSVNGEVALPLHHGTGDLREMELITAATQKRVRAQVDAAIHRIQQELRTDLFGFGKRIYYQHPRYFAAVDWAEHFPTLKIEPVVQVSLRRKGAMH